MFNIKLRRVENFNFKSVTINHNNNIKYCVDLESINDY